MQFVVSHKFNYYSSENRLVFLEYIIVEYNTLNKVKCRSS